MQIATYLLGFAFQSMVFLSVTGSLWCVGIGVAAAVARAVLTALLFFGIHGFDILDDSASLKRRLDAFNAKRATVNGLLWEGLAFAFLAWLLSPPDHATPMFLAALALGAGDVIIAVLKARGHLFRRRS